MVTDPPCVRRCIVSNASIQAIKPLPQVRSEESILDEEDGGVSADAEKREQAVAKRREARSVREERGGQQAEKGVGDRGSAFGTDGVREGEEHRGCFETGRGG